MTIDHTNLNTWNRRALVKYLYDVHGHVASFADDDETLRELVQLGLEIEAL